ncbi:MAG TPA: ABC transporter permease [Candidatus Acidoferrales bacterium]
MKLWRLTALRLRLVARNRAALFFTFIFPLVFLLVYGGLLAGSDPQATSYLMGPVVTLTVMGSGFWGLGIQLVMSRERGILRRFRLAPIGAGHMLGSSILANYLFQIPVILIEFAGAHWLFKMPWPANPLAIAFWSTLGLIAFSALGLIIASVANTMQETQVINNLFWFALLFLSGATIPLPMLPPWVQRFALFLPATYLVTALQGVMLRGVSTRHLLPEVAALLVAFAVGFGISWRLFRWEPEEKVSGGAKLWALACVLPFLLLGVWQNFFGTRLVEAQSFFQLLRPR